MVALFGILAGLALAAPFLQRYLLRHEERLTAKQLAQRDQRLHWVQWGFPLTKLAIVGCLYLVLWYGFGRLPVGGQGSSALLLAPSLASLPITEGCLALWTGVFDRSVTRDTRPPYTYDPERRLRWVAELETALGCAIALAGIVGFLVYR